MKNRLADALAILAAAVVIMTPISMDDSKQPHPGTSVPRIVAAVVPAPEPSPSPDPLPEPGIHVAVVAP